MALHASRGCWSPDQPQTRELKFYVSSQQIESPLANALFTAGPMPPQLAYRTEHPHFEAGTSSTAVPAAASRFFWAGDPSLPGRASKLIIRNKYAMTVVIIRQNLNGFADQPRGLTIRSVKAACDQRKLTSRPPAAPALPESLPISSGNWALGKYDGTAAGPT